MGLFKYGIILYICRILINDIIMINVATKDNFEALIGGEGLTLVDFWAVWCGPCRMLSPIVDEVSEDFAGKVSVVKCNVDDCEDIAFKFGIRSIPTLIFFKNGEVVDRIVGALPKAALVEKIEALL